MLENEQLAITKSECAFKYIRMHGLLNDGMAVYKEDSKENPEHNYMYVDALFDFLQSIGMKPFVELGFMPGALAVDLKQFFGGEEIESNRKNSLEFTRTIVILVNRVTTLR